MNVHLINHLATHVGLVDEAGVELSGGSPAYARQTVTWAIAPDGFVRPIADLTFHIPAGATVAGWRAYYSSTDETMLDGQLLIPQTFEEQGLFTLIAEWTAIGHHSGRWSDLRIVAGI